ncbi:uncharacterized protein LOC128930959 [Callithrix jacchus]
MDPTGNPPGLPAPSPWTPPGTLRASLLHPHGPHREPSGPPCSIPMDPTGNPLGLPAPSPWTPPGTLWASLLLPHGPHREPSGPPCSFPMDPTGNPLGLPAPSPWTPPGTLWASLLLPHGPHREPSGPPCSFPTAHFWALTPCGHLGSSSLRGGGCGVLAAPASAPWLGTVCDPRPAYRSAWTRGHGEAQDLGPSEPHGPLN